MFDKNLLLQHISNRSKTVEQNLREASEGGLMKHLKKRLSIEYGIDPNEIPSGHSNIGDFADAVFEKHQDAILNAHAPSTTRDASGTPKPSGGHISQIRNQFLNAVQNMHRSYNNRGSM